MRERLAGVEVIEGQDIVTHDLGVVALIDRHSRDIIIGHLPTIEIELTKHSRRLVQRASKHTAHHGPAHIILTESCGAVHPIILLHKGWELGGPVASLECVVVQIGCPQSTGTQTLVPCLNPQKVGDLRDIAVGIK